MALRVSDFGALSSCTIFAQALPLTLPDGDLASRTFSRMAHDLKDTLQLPKTDFPMRAGLAQREPGRVAHWEKIGLYERIQQKRAN